MELDDLIIVWKKQDENIHLQLQNKTLKYLFKERSKGVLSKIRKCLTRELFVIVVLFILFNVLFILIKLPYTMLRWGCFAIFNSISLWYIYYYKNAITVVFNLKYNEDLRANMERIIKCLSRFRNQYRLLNLPIVFLCIVMFAGSQNLFFLLPWMIVEMLLWRSLFLPRLVLRFEDYKADLEYSLRNLQELND